MASDAPAAPPLPVSLEDFGDRCTISWSQEIQAFDHPGQGPWFVRIANQAVPITQSAAGQNGDTCSLFYGTGPGPNPGPSGVAYSPPPNLVVSAVNGVPAAPFAFLPFS